MSTTPLDILKQYWGYDAFRPLQEEIIQSVLEAKDTLALLPTGGGKSICYQVPALCLEGITLVISPLIALMKDQIFQLQKREIKAAAIYTGMHYRDIDRILDNCIYGQTKLLYLSPERLMTELVQARIKQMKVNLIAVDEAHCISQWGYDFRPAYLNIAQCREWLPKVPILALTATATPEVVEDIQEKLAFRTPLVFSKSFERENLVYVVLKEENKGEKMFDILQKVAGSAIVYVRSRRKAEQIAQWLKRKGMSAEYYHAGLSTDERSVRQTAWINNQQRIMVSTNAFGMGIDKADVRVVVHWEAPESPEAYFQEAGRAGRDGQKSYAVLLYAEGDGRRMERQFEQAYPSMEVIREVYQALGNYFQLAVGGGEGQSYDFDLAQLAKTYDLEPRAVYHSTKVLAQSGWIWLSEAVFVPSTLQVIVGKEALYDFQLRNRNFDRLLKTILRSYQGAFTQPVHLKEAQLAKFLNISLEDLRRSFQTLQQNGIIRYKPQKDQPQLIFLKERVAPQNLIIDQEHYRFRKARHELRLRAMLRYATQIRCRSQQLLEYFGQDDAPLCGQCDVCLGRHKKEVDEADFERYKIKIQRLLKRDALTTEEVLEAFSPKYHERILEVLQYLLSEQYIKQDQNNRLVLNKS